MAETLGVSDFHATCSTNPSSLFFGLLTREDARCAIVNRIFNTRRRVSGTLWHQPVSRAGIDAGAVLHECVLQIGTGELGARGQGVGRQG